MLSAEFNVEITRQSVMALQNALLQHDLLLVLEGAWVSAKVSMLRTGLALQLWG